MYDPTVSIVEESTDNSSAACPIETEFAHCLERSFLLDHGDLGPVAREFLAPNNDNRPEFLNLLSKVVDVLFDELIERESCFSGRSPGELRNLFAVDDAARGGIYSEDDLVEILRNVVRNSINLANPKSLAHMSSTPLKISVIADLAASVLNQSLDTWDQSPSATEVERAVIKHFRDVSGLPVKAGWMTPGGTMSNFQAIVLARDSKLQGLAEQSNSRDSQASRKRYDLFSRLRAFCCEETHFSIEKGLHLAGFGDDALIKIPARRDGSIDTLILEGALDEEVRSGNIPFLIVGTAGTTNLGAIDDLSTLAAIASKYSSWFHVDAAYGGACLFSNSHRRLLDGLELAASITLDGHKFLYQPISCGVLLLLNKSGQTTVGRNQAVPYLSSSNVLFEEAYDSYHETILTTRRFDALKLYLCFRLLSPEFFAEVIDSRVQLAKWFWQALSKEDDFEVVEPRLNIVVFRYHPDGLDQRLVDRTNTGVWSNTFRSGELLLSLTRYEGHPYLRAVIMNPLTTRADLAKIIKILRRSGQRLLAGNRSVQDNAI